MKKSHGNDKNSFWGRIRKIVRKKWIKYKSIFLKYTIPIKKILKKYIKENGSTITRFMSYIVVYGIMINLMLTFIFNSPIWMGSIIGYGIAWYVLRQEFPDFIRSIRRAR